MIVTLFHRATDAVYDEECDQALAPVLDDADAPAGFVSTVWGEFVASDALHQAFCEDSEVDAVLASWGLHLVPPPVEEAIEEPIA